jgi:aspartate ammonia-lyase
MRHFVEHSIGIVTALVPVIGYEQASDIARTALSSGRGVYEIVLERALMTREQLDGILNPAAMTAPRNVTQEFSTVARSAGSAVV